MRKYRSLTSAGLHCCSPDTLLRERRCKKKKLSKFSLVGSSAGDSKPVSDMKPGLEP